MYPGSFVFSSVKKIRTTANQTRQRLRQRCFVSPAPRPRRKAAGRKITQGKKPNKINAR